MATTKIIKQYELVETQLQIKKQNGSTQCQLCLWQCNLRHGQRGFCQAHVNRYGTLYNLTYGIISAMDIGRIEDKPVRHYQPGSKILSVGSYGCNFRCQGCHNLEISWGEDALDQLARGESTSAFVPAESLVDCALRHGLQGIAFTYSEPAIWLEYIIDVAKIARSKGLFLIYVSNSFISRQALEFIAPHIQVLCSDIKSMRQDFYQEICVKAKLDEILDSICYAQELGIHVETRSNIIPGKNDNIEELQKTAEWIRDNLGEQSPWHITKFFPAYQLSHIKETPSETLQSAYKIARQIGLQNVYVYDDTGCDCAQSNLPVTDYLLGSSETIHQQKKCAASCCSDSGILLKKYE